LPEYRKDIILDEWVIIATERAKRPENFKEQIIKVENKSLSVCPFDMGNEAMTPPESLRIDSFGNEVDKDGQWQIRVVPNKFPALVPNAQPFSKQYGPYMLMDGFGLHEVVVQSPEHITNISELSLRQMELLVSVYVKRLQAIKKDSRIESVVIMLNQGKEAGASLEHSHSQIFALPLTPPILMNEISRTRSYFNHNHRCAMCDIIDFEIKEDKRVVYENKEFLVLQPYASRNPFETWIIPKFHDSNFENISAQQAGLFAQCLKMLVDFFYLDLNNPPFNYYIHTGTLGSAKDSSHYHWHLELEPKLSIKAGFEIATGIDICITTPEYTAEYMKAGDFFKV
jgi:UDPglucose--hexose-1-phosphate uridylyltransferase